MSGSEFGMVTLVFPHDFDSHFGAIDCLGGGPCWMTAKAHCTFLSAVAQHNPKLLWSGPYTELFRPQRAEVCEKAMNEDIGSSTLHTQFLGLWVAPAHKVPWSLAGLTPKEAVEGCCSVNTVMCAGATSNQWFIDTGAGVWGTCLAQIIPPMHFYLFRLN